MIDAGCEILIPFFKQCVAVYIIAERDGKILFVKRRGTGFMDGYWGLPAGKVDEGEDLIAAAIREAREEVGIALDPADLAFCHLAHRRAAAQAAAPYWIDVYFRARNWRGTPFNAEPHKAETIAWRALPDMAGDGNLIMPYVAHVLAKLVNGAAYSDYGWGGMPG